MKPYQKSKILTFIVHLLFWALACWFFCEFSLMRPMSLHKWKEALSILFVAGMVYTSYFIFIPQLLFKGKRLLFWICVGVLLSVSVLAEMTLVDSDIRIRALWLQADKFRLYYENTIFLLLLRNATFFFFFMLIKLYHANAIKIENLAQTLSQETNKLIIVFSQNKIQLVDFDCIAYFTYTEKYITINLKNGECIKQNGYLSELEKLIPPELCIRVNRKTIVMRDCIVHYTPSFLRINVDGTEHTFTYYSTKKDEILENLQAWNPDLYLPEDSDSEPQFAEEPENHCNSTIHQTF